MRVPVKVLRQDTVGLVNHAGLGEKWNYPLRIEKSPKSADSSAPWSAWLAAGCVHLDEWRDFRYAFLGPIERRTK